MVDQHFEVRAVGHDRGDMSELPGGSIEFAIETSGAEPGLMISDLHDGDRNPTGSFNVTQAAARAMIASSKPGHVIMMGSWVESVAWPEIAAYSASKAGIHSLARTAALELAEHQVRVNVIAPGIVNAGLAAHQLATERQYAARSKARSRSEHFKQSTKLQTSPRSCVPTKRTT